MQLPEHAGDVRPGVAPKVPAGHCPLQAAVASPCTAPKRPAAQSVHAAAPAKEYLPDVQMAELEKRDPGGQKYPESHAPTHWLVVWAPVSPYRPGAHCPLQAAVVRPAVDPNRPAAQSVQVLAPARAYCPAAHCTAVGDVDPAGHAYPAVQLPEHWLVV